MSTGADLIALADRLRWAPYFLGYAIDTDVEDPKAAYERDGANHLFVEWNTAIWRKQCERIGFHADNDWTVSETIGMASVSPNIKAAMALHCDLIAEKLGDKLDRYIAAHPAPRA
jgi:hypothetical protein